MKLLNCSAGRVQSVQISGESVRTAHVKAPVPEPWVITPEGLQGDERAVHPDKVYAFARSAYDYWGRYLKLDPASWSDGFFGENLTLDHLDERDVRIGDVFTLGPEVRLFVSGARTPCLKLAWRLGQPRTFQRIFAQSRQTGVYLGVMNAGIVRRGDSLVRVHHDPSMPSVADLCDLIQDHRPPPLEPLRKLLAFEGLSPVIRFMLEFKRASAEGAAAANQERWSGWRRFVIERIVEEAADIRSVHLRPQKGGALYEPRPGQFVSVLIPGTSGAPVTRCWSLSAHAAGMDHYRLTVRRQVGPGSNWIHAAQPGDTLQLRAPSGAFTLDTGGFKPVVLVAGGIGITPLMAMLQAHVRREQPPPIRLFYSVRTPQDAAFTNELAALATHPGVRINRVYTRRAPDGLQVGRIDAAYLMAALSDMTLELNGHSIPIPWYECDMYLCGPADFCASIKAELIRRGANADRVFTESFVAPELESSELASAEVRFTRNGRTVTWQAEEDLSLLELAERAGLQPASDCRAGACLTCKTRVVEGSTTADVEGGALLCVGRPRTPRLSLDL